MKAFILAGGFGTRLREVVHGRPKCLAPVAGRPFLEYLICHLRDQGVRDFVLGVGYLAHYVIDAFGDGSHLDVAIQYSEEDRPLGTAGAIRHAEKLLRGSDFLVANGDTYLALDVDRVLRAHQDKQAALTIVTAKRQAGLRGGRVFANKTGRVTGFEEHGTRQKKGSHGVNAGYYVFSPKTLKQIAARRRLFIERHLLPELLRLKQPIFASRSNREYIDIGSPERYLHAQKVFGE